MADVPDLWLVAVNACPLCGRAMPDRTDEDYLLAARGMGGAWSEEIQRVKTGVWFLDDCGGCGEFLSGVEYRPELVRVEVCPESPPSFVFDRWVAWYALG